MRLYAKRAVKWGVQRFPAQGLANRIPNGMARAALLDLADRQARWRPRDFVTRTVYGFRIEGNTADFIQRRICIFGVWDPSLSNWMTRHLQGGDVVIDIGANIGYFSLLGSSLVGPSGRVLAFEPVPAILDQLRANLAANDAANVEVHPIALGASDGEVRIFPGPRENLGQSSTSPRTNSGAFARVPMRTAVGAIDPALWPRIRLVKVDVEGDELAVLHGMEALLESLRPGAAVVAELTPAWLAARGKSLEEAMSYMDGLGFAAQSLEAANHSPSSRPSRARRLTPAPTVQTDVLFIKTGKEPLSPDDK